MFFRDPPIRTLPRPMDQAGYATAPASIRVQTRPVPRARADRNAASIFSRPWFAWANSLFGELMLNVATQRPRVFSLLDS